ncbi:MAG: hypothetical protein NVS3B27_01120 [Novosphingobium sp.]
MGKRAGQLLISIGVCAAIAVGTPAARAQADPAAAPTLPAAPSDAADPVLAAMIEAATQAIGTGRQRRLNCYTEGYCESWRIIDVDPVTLRVDQRYDEQIYDAGDMTTLSARYARQAHHRWPTDTAAQKAFVVRKIHDADTLAAMRKAAILNGVRPGFGGFVYCSIEGFCTARNMSVIDVDPLTLKIDARDEVDMIYAGDEAAVRARLEKVWRDRKPDDPVGQQKKVAVYLGLYEFKAINAALGMSFHLAAALGGDRVTPNDVPFVVEVRYRSDNAAPGMLAQLTNGQFGKPWQARHACGGALIASQWVLTAAHCVKPNSIEKSALAVQVGVGDISRLEGTQINVDGAVIHSGYRRLGDKDFYSDDIALLHLASRATQVVGVKTIALAKGFAGDGLSVSAVGWGLNRDVSQDINATAVLTRVGLSVLANDRCARVQGQAPGDDFGLAKVVDRAGGIHEVARIHPKVICARGEFRKTCEGDSGGPLYRSEAADLVGIVSWNKDGCNIASADEPGVYTRVDAYRGWIDQAMARKLQGGQRMMLP